jgi:hypothetical protein
MCMRSVFLACKTKYTPLLPICFPNLAKNKTINSTIYLKRFSTIFHSFATMVLLLFLSIGFSICVHVFHTRIEYFSHLVGSTENVLRAAMTSQLSVWVYWAEVELSAWVYLFRVGERWLISAVNVVLNGWSIKYSCESKYSLYRYIHVHFS